MRKRPLPKGKFTGIVWSDPQAASGMDPYLAWLEACGFPHRTGKKDPHPSQLPLIIELKPGKTVDQLAAAVDPKWLWIPPVYTASGAPRPLRFCTARARPEFFRQFRKPRLSNLIERFELGLAAGEHACGAWPNDAHPGPKSFAGPLLTGKVMGVIDGGLALVNERFLLAGKARVQYFWKQDTNGIGSRPSDLHYGHELTASAIDTAIANCTFGGLLDEGAVYQQLGLPDLRRLVNHGTHVTDLACGPRTLRAQLASVPPHLNAPPTWQVPIDAASQCNLIAVQLDWATVLDTSGGSMNVHILDGLMYILARCDPQAKIAVNISWGTLAGPHDGSSALEAAMDALIALRRKRLHIVVPAGNGYQSQAHATAQLKRGQRRSLTWSVQADDRTQSFVELWIAGRRGKFGNARVRLTPPGSAPLDWVSLSESAMWSESGQPPVCAIIFPGRVATGMTGTCALIALAPTAASPNTASPSTALQANAVLAPCGNWTLEIENTGKDTLVFDAYVERDDVPIGTPGLGGRQSYFTDDHYDTSGNPGSFVDDPGNPTLIRRSGNFNSISTGKYTTKVGGTRLSDGSWAVYSPRVPDPDHAKPTRPGVVKVPNASAVSDLAPDSVGVPAAGSRSAAVVRLVGTSSAAPQVTRELFNKFKP